MAGEYRCVGVYFTHVIRPLFAVTMPVIVAASPMIAAHLAPMWRAARATLGMKM